MLSSPLQSRDIPPRKAKPSEIRVKCKRLSVVKGARFVCALRNRFRLIFALDVAWTKVCFLRESLVVDPHRLRRSNRREPGSFILNTLGSSRGAASNEIRDRCIEGRRRTQFSITFPCCAWFVVVQNGAAAQWCCSTRGEGRLFGAGMHMSWPEGSSACAIVFEKTFAAARESLHLLITFCGAADARERRVARE